MQPCKLQTNVCHLCVCNVLKCQILYFLGYLKYENEYMSELPECQYFCHCSQNMRDAAFLGRRQDSQESG